MTTSETIPPELQARWEAHRGKDAALADVEALSTAMKAAQETSRLARVLAHLVAANDPRLSVALDSEVARAFGLSQQSANAIRIANRGQANWEATRDALLGDIDEAMATVRTILLKEK